MSENPVTRSLRLSGVKPIDLAKHLGLSRQYISRCQYGTIGNLSTKVTRWCRNVLAHELGENIADADVIRYYHQYQDSKRIQAFILIGQPGLPGYESAEEFISWRKKFYPGGRYSFAVAWCVHPNVVTFYEDGIVKKMPTMMREAFENVRRAAL